MKSRAVLKCFPPQFEWETHDSRIRISAITTGNELKILGKSHTHTNIA